MVDYNFNVVLRTANSAREKAQMIGNYVSKALKTLKSNEFNREQREFQTRAKNTTLQETIL
jgi:2,3-bisphosphoglycerate-independent phosphoglycerate mutase